MSKIALFGGTFDPPHIGHIEVVLSLLEQNHVDEVWVVPVRQNPLKKEKASEPLIRKAMVEAAFSQIPKVRILYDELEMPSPSYTIDTIRHLKKKYPLLSTNELFFVVGSDAFKEKNQWKEIDELEKELIFLVVQRDGFEYVPTPSSLCISGLRLDISSTLLRQRVREGRSIFHLVPPAVLRSIIKHRLYL